MTTEIIAFGERANLSKLDIPWFSGFNTYFTEFFLGKHFKIKWVQPNNKLAIKNYVYKHINVNINVNNLILYNSSNDKAVCFSTFYMLRQLYNSNKEFFNNHLVKCFSGHYNDTIIKLEWPSSLIDKISPWYFRPALWHPNLIHSHKYNPSIKQSYFRGVFIKHSRDFIQILSKLNDPEINTHIKKEPPHTYAHNLSTSTCAINAPGVRDMCHRDIENFAIGIPTIRPKFTSRMLTSIPEEVYLPVDHSFINKKGSALTGMPSDHTKLSELVLEKWKEVKDDISRLQEISNKSQDFYREHFSNDSICKKSLTLLHDCGFFN
jgi:hypothetical protein